MAAIDPLVERGLPRESRSAEKAVLGAILLDNGAYNAAAAMIVGDDFSVDANRRIYQRMIALREGAPARPIDFTTLTEELLANQRTRRGGRRGLSFDAHRWTAPRAVNTEHYARIVKDKSVLRRMIHTAHNIVQEGLDGGYQDESGKGGGITEFLDRAESAILHRWARTASAPDLTPLAEMANEVYAAARRRQRGQRSINGLQTGFKKFDEMTRGLHAGRAGDHRGASQHGGRRRGR